MKHTKKLLMMVLLLSMVFGCMSVSKPASAKSVSKITKVFTLTTQKKGISHILSMDRKEKVFTKMEFLEVKGKISEKFPSLGFYESYNMGWLFDDDTSPSKLDKKSFKKGKKFTSKKDYLQGKSLVEWDIPNGIKKLKIKVTYYAKSGKACIRSLKEKERNY